MKISELKRILKKKNLDFALFYSLGMEPNPNMVYFAQYYGVGALIVPKKQPHFLVVPKMEYERAKSSLVKKVYSMDKKRFFESINLTLKKDKLKMKNIGIDKSAFTLLAYKGFKKCFKSSKTKDLAFDCMRLREIKTKEEIKTIKKAFNYGNKIIKKAIKNFKSFRTESEAAAFLEYEAKKLGLGMSFPPIVASGKNACMPHHMPKNTKLQKGFCVIDFGIKHKGYCTDITRTIYIGKPTKQEKDIYNFLLKIQKNIINNIKLDDNCGKIYENCVKALKNYSRYFTHGLGHGVGVEIHELPNLALNSKGKIRESIVFTIEPGIYIPKKLGIRIEDSILMGKKPIILTNAPKDLLIV
ncbi:aminopeptidase P family protein [Candidatus Woesearchaeota archaeon]|nr:aminopeptidase P family protein [Candidatus Woesearchaeota archaeon]